MAKKDVEFASGILVGVGLMFSADVLRRLTDPREWTHFADSLTQLTNELQSTIQNVATVDTTPTSTDSISLLEDGGALHGTE